MPCLRVCYVLDVIFSLMRVSFIVFAIKNTRFFRINNGVDWVANSNQVFS